MPRHHVLLVGIDAYDGGGSLKGCVNDIDAVQRVLVERAGIDPGRIKRLASPRFAAGQAAPTETLPTLDNLRAALAGLGGEEVQPGDHVFIYYSGHGTQCIVKTADGRRFSREALLPKDKVRGIERRFLFDWELNQYLAAIAQRTPRVTVVLDCCSSGGATRGLGDEGEDGDDGEPSARYWPTTELVELAEGAAPATAVRGVTVAATGLQHCQVIAACRDEERARESAVADGEVPHGELTRALIAQLEAMPNGELATVRWGRIWRAVEATVVAANPRQHPWIAGSFGAEVFGFAGDAGDPGYTVEPLAGGYRLDVGTLHGITHGARIAVYGADPPEFPPLGSPADMEARKGHVVVENADDARCTGVAEGPFDLPEAARGRLVAPGDDARLRVRLVPEDAAVAKLLAPSPFVALVAERADVEVVRRADGGWGLADDLHSALDEPPALTLATVPAERLDRLAAVVEHYHAYLAPVRLARMCRDLPSQLQLRILDCKGQRLTPEQAQGAQLPLVESHPYAPYGVKHGDPLCFAVENTADVELAVTLIDCGASGRVQLIGERRMPAHSTHLFWAGEALGAPFTASLPAGRTAGVDRLVAIGTTSPRASLRHLLRSTSFADVLNARAFRDLEDEPTPPEQWTAALTTLRIER